VTGTGERLDDLGHPVRVAGPAARVVSLVPSLTEAIAVTRRQALAGATQWCTHPADLDVPRVRGTKNPDVPAIVALRPDIVLANQEENRRLDVDRLRQAGVEVWVTVIRSVAESFASMRRMFTDGLAWPVPGWLDEAACAWAAPHEGPRRRAVICVWRDPWMVVGRDTFTGDLAARLGLANAYSDHADRYPRVELADILARDPQVVVLPDEPYAFTATDGPEAFPGHRVALVSGRDLTWYGPSLVTARARLAALLLPAATRRPCPRGCRRFAG
jgi:ABC-type Fe3+-hydroxamate transport system substrate-binding protein